MISLKWSIQWRREQYIRYKMLNFVWSSIKLPVAECTPDVVRSAIKIPTLTQKLSIAYDKSPVCLVPDQLGKPHSAPITCSESHLERINYHFTFLGDILIWLSPATTDSIFQRILCQLQISEQVCWEFVPTWSQSGSYQSWGGIGLAKIISEKCHPLSG